VTLSGRQPPGGEWPIPCHIVTPQVAVTSAVLLPATVSRQPIPCRIPRSATHDGAGGPLATSEQALAMAATAFLVQPSVARSTRRSNEWTLTRLVHELDGDRRSRRSPLTVTASRNADARPTTARSAPYGAAAPFPPRGPRQRARREVELASVRDCYDDPHRRSLTAAPTPRPASLPWPLPQASFDEPHGWRPRASCSQESTDGGPIGQP
jgi:hypothetical protein